MSLCLIKYIIYTLEKVDYIVYFKANILTVFSIKTGLKFSMCYNVTLIYTPRCKYILVGFECCRYKV